MRNVIALRGNPREEQGFRAAEQLTPGMLVEFDASGGKGVVSHIASGGTVSPVMFVREQHERLGHGIDDPIPHGDSCTILFPGMGDVINAFTTDTFGIGDRAASDGAGGVKVATSGQAVIGVAAGPTETQDSIMRVPIIIGACQAE